MPMDLSNIDEAIAYARRRWPGFEFVASRNGEEAHGPCPLCGEADEDGFILWISGYYLCRPGGCQGWLDENERQSLTPEQKAIRRLEAARVREERRVDELERRLSAVERLNCSGMHERYYNNLDADAYGWWLDKGAAMHTIHDYKLGYCPRCPTTREHGPSYTIPIWNQERDQLLNIRHRIAHAANGDKYRPEMAGLGTQLAFPHHLIDAGYGLVVEGAIKAMIAHQAGFPAVGVMGKRGRFKGEWLRYFPDGAPIYIALDPDAQENAERLGAGIAATGKRVFVASLPMKPDDLILAGKPADLEHYLHLARRVH